MKPGILNLLAACLLAATGVLIYCESRSPSGKSSANSPSSVNRNEMIRPRPHECSPRVLESDHSSTKGIPVDPAPESHSAPDSLSAGRDTFPTYSASSQSAGRSEGETRSIKNSIGLSTSSEDFTRDEPHNRAIQLSENFQLPAAMMSQARATGPQTDSPTPPVEKYKRNMIDDFYRNLAAVTPARNPTPSRETSTSMVSEPTTVNDMQEESTTIIEPGPETNDVRHRSDELYRSIFGNEAYGRMMMQSTLEVQLPGTTPVSPGDI